MNYAKAIEQAYAKAVRRFCDLGAGAVVRAWQTLRADVSWSERSAGENPYGDRFFPMVDIRCGPPATDAEQNAFYSDVIIKVGTIPKDDADHAIISKMHGEVHDLVEAIHWQFLRGTEGDEITAITDELENILGPGLHIGGFTWGDADPPSDADGYNVMSVAQRIHYTRSDI